MRPRRRAYRFITVTLIASACGARSDGEVLVTSGATDQVYALHAATGIVEDSITVDRRRGETDEPHGIAVSPTQTHWYVTLAHGEPTLWKFETIGNRLVGRLTLNMSGAARIGISADGEMGFIPDYYRDNVNVLGEVTAVRLHNMEITRKGRVCSAPHDAQPAPDGAYVAVTCSASDEVVFLDPETLRALRTVPLVDSTHAKPMNVVWDPDGTSAYVTLHLSNAVAQVSPTSGVLRIVPVGMGPAQLALSAPHNVLVVANRMDGTASLVSLPDLAETSRLPLDVIHPHGVAVSTDGQFAFITYEGDADTRGGVVALDLNGRTVRWRREIGTFTLGVTYITHN